MYELFANRGDLARVAQGRGFDYLVPVTALTPSDDALWVADLRLLVAVEKGWLVGRTTLPAFADEDGYDRLATQLAQRFSRPAYASIVVTHVLRPTQTLIAGIVDRYEGRDPIVEIGLALGRSRLEPVNAQLVFMLDGELPHDLRDQITNWWQPVAEEARSSGLEFIAPRFVSVDELSARDYRALDLLDAATLSPDSDEAPDAV